MQIVVLCLTCIQVVCGLNPVYRLHFLLDSFHGFPSPLQAQCFNKCQAFLMNALLFNVSCHFALYHLMVHKHHYITVQ
jgi:hypothetical protein